MSCCSEDLHVKTFEEKDDDDDDDHASEQDDLCVTNGCKGEIECRSCHRCAPCHLLGFENNSQLTRCSMCCECYNDDRSLCAACGKCTCCCACFEEDEEDDEDDENISSHKRRVSLCLVSMYPSFQEEEVKGNEASAAAAIT